MDRKEMVSGFLSLIFNDEKLSTPVYIGDIESEEDADSREILPLLYIWRRTGRKAHSASR